MIHAMVHLFGTKCRITCLALHECRRAYKLHDQSINQSNLISIAQICCKRIGGQVKRLINPISY